MITLPVPLNKVMQSGDLKGIKPFAVLYRNKWYAEESASGFEESDSGSDLGGHFALDMANPIDISSMIVKPNTLSMTLDVNEVAQYKANNVTLTLSDPFNKFIEGTPQSYFPAGYQLYGSQVVLYYGLDETNRTPLFVGVIKDLPTHKPEQYQVDLKLISPLELLSDIEAKDFSNKYYNETLTSAGTDDDNNPIYQTAHTGVGGFYAVYADGNKMFEGVDYEVSQTNELSLPALVTIINADLHSVTITADYYCWKTGLSVEQIVSGLVALAGYINNTDIRSVVWQTSVLNIDTIGVSIAVGFRMEDGICKGYTRFIPYGSAVYGLILPNNFSTKLRLTSVKSLTMGDYINDNDTPANGFIIKTYTDSYNVSTTSEISYYENSSLIRKDTLFSVIGNYTEATLERNGKTFTLTYTYVDNVTIPPTEHTVSSSYTYGSDFSLNEFLLPVDINPFSFFTYKDSNNSDVYTVDLQNFTNFFALSALKDTGANTTTLVKLTGTYEYDTSLLVGGDFSAYFTTSENNITENWQNVDLGADIGQDNRFFQFLFVASPIFIYNSANMQGFIVENFAFSFLSSDLTLQFVNLSGKTVLEALQDFALISGYEFGVDRQGTFFFRPRSQSTTPVYDLDSNEIVKIDNISKKFNDFFTKLTLTFAQVPLEFYANEGTRPTPIDKYGVINKEIDKPDIVNYDNPELAQAIGPQLLAIYSNLADIIQLTGKLNLNLELGDIVNVKRNYNLTAPESASDYDKFICQNTYYQAAKITGLNYNFGKRQITYTLRNVSNSNNQPQPPVSSNQFPYDLPINF